MHPIFLAHLAADFLLQPNWLVQWKEKRVAGVVMHAAIHGLIMLIMLLPLRLDVFVTVAIVALLHGLIDQAKIAYQKKHKSFGEAFLLDQFAHLVVLVAAIFLMRSPFHIFWTSEAGRGIFWLLFFFSFSFALGHLFRLKKFPLKNPQQIALRLLLIIGVFAAFLIPAKLFGTSFCSLL